MVNGFIFWDRDGVVNELVKHPEKTLPGPPWKLSELKLINGIGEVMTKVAFAGYKNVIISNQPDLRDGYMTAADIVDINDMLRSCLPIVDIKSCYDRSFPDNIPDNGMIEYYTFNRKDSWIVGDTWKDIAAGEKSKINTILFVNSRKDWIDFSGMQPDFVVYSLNEVAEVILNEY